jgi:hypothetical protein
MGNRRRRAISLFLYILFGEHGNTIVPTGRDGTFSQMLTASPLGQRSALDVIVLFRRFE